MKSSVHQQWTPFKQSVVPSNQRDFHEYWVNRSHTVLVRYVANDFPYETKPDGWMYLSIRRNDRKAECDWRIFQRIKDEVAGKDREAVQLFPAIGRVLDTSNQYHLWVAPKNCVIGIGQMAGEVSEKTFGGAVQRPFTVDDPLRELVGEPNPIHEKVPFYPLPLYPTFLFSVLTSKQYRSLSLDDQQTFLKGFLPHPPDTEERQERRSSFSLLRSFASLKVFRKFLGRFMRWG